MIDQRFGRLHAKAFLPRISPMLVCILFLFPLLSSACPPSVPTHLLSNPTAAHTFTPANRTIAVPPYTTVHLLLKSNPSTGYTWSLHPSSTLASSTSYTITACQYKRHVHKPGMVGVGGDEVWEVEVGSGSGGAESRLALQYNRVWEGDKAEADVVWTIRVTEPTTDSTASDANNSSFSFVVNTAVD